MLVEVPTLPVEKDKMKQGIALGITFLAGFILLFVLLNYSENIPYYDDFDVILDLLWRGQRENMTSLLMVRNNEHIVFTTKIIAYFQYLLTGKVNFYQLIIIGNLFLLGIPLLFYRMTKSVLLTALVALIFFVPYSELNIWAMGSIQNLGVVFLAFLSIYLTFKSNWVNFGLAIFFGLLAVVTSGNGFLAFATPIPVLLFAHYKNYEHKNIEKPLIKAGILFVLTIICLFAYFKDSSGQLKQSLFTEFSVEKVMSLAAYFLTLIGSFFKVLTNLTAFRFLPYLGILMLLYLLYNLKNMELYLANPAITSFLLFVLGSAFMLTLARVNFGVDQSLSDRYFIIPACFIACLTTFVFLKHQSWITKNFYGILIGFILFNGYRLVHNISDYNTWQNRLEVSMQSYLKGGPEALRYFDVGIPKVKDILDNSIANDFYVSPIREKAVYTPIEGNLGRNAVDARWNVIVNNSSCLTLEGWAHIKQMSTDGQQVYFVIGNNNKRYKTPLISERLFGAEKVFTSKDYYHSGFRGSISKEDLSTLDISGNMEIGVGVESKDGVFGYLPFPTAIQVAQSLDNPELATISLEDIPQEGLTVAWDSQQENDRRLDIAGWGFLSVSAEPQEEQKSLLLIGNQNTYKIPVNSVLREDVTQHFNNGENYDYSGFNVKINKNNLKIPSNTYQLGLLIERADGANGYTLSDTKITL